MAQRRPPADVATVQLRSGAIRLSDRIAAEPEAQILRRDLGAGPLLPAEGRDTLFRDIPALAELVRSRVYRQKTDGSG